MTLRSIPALGRWAAVAVLLAAPAAAQPRPVGAEGGADAPLVAEDGAGRPTVRRFAVDDVFVERVAPRCTFQSRVHGTVTERATPDGAPVYRVEYVPALSVRSFVRCEGREALEWERRVPEATFSREELAQEVARRARIVTRATGHACAYAPTFAFDGRTFAGTWLRQGCGFGAEGPARAER